MIKNAKKGFTLIELLVVIAIIGMLSSVILASLNSARAKAADSAVKENLNNMRAQAEIVYDNASPNKYTLVCTDASVLKMLAAAQSASGVAPVCNANNLSAPNAAWAAQATLKGAGGFWCVDSTGTARTDITPLGAGFVCPSP